MGKEKFLYAFIIFAPPVFMLFSLSIGRFPLPVSEIFQILWCKLTAKDCTLPAIHQSVIWDVRLPRVVLGAFVGGCLATNGAAFQGMFKNPLVSSGILGVSSGAGFGAALGILLFKTASATYPLAFLFGILAVCLSFLIGRIYSATPVITLVLGGLIVSLRWMGLSRPFPPFFLDALPSVVAGGVTEGALRTIGVTPPTAEKNHPFFFPIRPSKKYL